MKKSREFNSLMQLLNKNEVKFLLVFGPTLRRIIYTTNIVEGFHRQIRKCTKNKSATRKIRLLCLPKNTGKMEPTHAQLQLFCPFFDIYFSTCMNQLIYFILKVFKCVSCLIFKIRFKEQITKFCHTSNCLLTS